MGYYRLVSLISGKEYKHREIGEIHGETKEGYVNYLSRGNAPAELAMHLGIEQGKPHKTLEIGSGICWFQALSAKKFPKCFFICSDIGLKNLKTAKAGIKDKNVGVVAAHSEMLSLKPGSMDSVLIFNTIEHLNSAENTIADVSVVLKPGGKCYFNAPNKFGLGHLDSAYLGKVREFSYFELKRIAKEAGMKAEFIPPEKPLDSSRVKKILFALAIYTNLWRVFKPHGFRVLLTKPD